MTAVAAIARPHPTSNPIPLRVTAPLSRRVRGSRCPDGGVSSREEATMASSPAATIASAIASGGHSMAVSAGIGPPPLASGRESDGDQRPVGERRVDVVASAVRRSGAAPSGAVVVAPALPPRRRGRRPQLAVERAATSTRPLRASGADVADRWLAPIARAACGGSDQRVAAGHDREAANRPSVPATMAAVADDRRPAGAPKPGAEVDASRACGRAGRRRRARPDRACRTR